MNFDEFLAGCLAGDLAELDDQAEFEAETLRHDGLPDLTAEDVRELWLTAGVSRWPRWVAEVEVKRRTLAEHRHTRERRGCCSEHPPEPYDFWDCDVCVSASRYPAGWCTTVRLIGELYADRPGYREEWRPTSGPP
jgi:hypothetical protein